MAAALEAATSVPVGVATMIGGPAAAARVTIRVLMQIEDICCALWQRDAHTDLPGKGTHTAQLVATREGLKPSHQSSAAGARA